MKTNNFIIICLLSVGLFTMSHTTVAKEKVILDTDMVEIFDDGIAMMMLQLAPNIDLLGVTVVVGNSWLPEGTAYALRQLEAIKATNIPVAMGLKYPLRQIGRAHV